MIPLLLEELCSNATLIHSSSNPKLIWRDRTPTAADMAAMKREAETGAQFDPAGLKRWVWEQLQSGAYVVVSKECELAQVTAILPKQHPGIPTADWGRIFQWFGRAARGGPWKVYWFGAPKERTFPGDGLPVAAEHLNGGYTQVCSTNGIFMYRLEEATRVLIHELLHAACLDPPGSDIPYREAFVETWAELILIAHRARGGRAAAQHLWRKQAQWVVDTSAKAAANHGVRSKNDYGWRYLNGRLHIYEKLGIALPSASQPPWSQRSRFTHPALGD